ncbi:hypothetical protein [Ornithinibacillus bavariensis]|uniref:hypothetical protein n=1 Tax=Ornithinibacillus bavariensis TaxID=545502 RepID=UPI000EDF330E|nr:hypothetical protein [Ornithinibacillus sp.]
MVTRYVELNEIQQDNIFFLLDKSQRHELNRFKDFGIKPGKNKHEFRRNVLYGLMMEMIDFEFFLKWLCHVHLEGNNNIFVYEPDDTIVFSNKNKKKLIKALNKKKKNIYDINKDSLEKINLVDVEHLDKKLLLTFAAPSFVVKERVNNTAPEVERDIYLAYITVDFMHEHIVLSLHPTHNLYSISGVQKKRNFDLLAKLFINHFRENFFPFSFSDPDWIIDALAEITEEYFDHNNPMITKKMLVFENEHLPSLVDKFIEKEEKFKNSSAKMRIQKALKELYELQLIGEYGNVPKETNFQIFLNETGKGVTSFKADSGGGAFNFADSYEIVKKMIENADISSIGISYAYEGNQYKYKLVKEANFYSLKRGSTAATKKEIVDNVLCQLKKYQPREESTNTSEQVKDS